MTRPPDPELAEFGDVPDPFAAAQPRAEDLRLPVLSPSPERSQVQSRRLAALVGSSAWVGVHLAVFGVRRDLGDLPFAYVLAQILLPFAFAVLALAVALAPGRLGLGARLAVVISLAVLGPASFALIAVGTPVPAGVSSGVTNAVGMLICFDLAVAWAAVPLLLAALTLRGAFAASARWRSALVGAGAGLFAGATINLHCSNVAPLHMLFGHGLPVIVATVAGALLLALRTRS